MASNDNNRGMDLHMDYGLKPTHTIVGAGIICFLATVFVLLRVYCRVRLTKAFGIDDWILLLAFTLFMATSSVFIARGAAAEMLSSDIELMTDTPELGQLGLATLLLYLVAQIALKLALATFFLRIPGNRVTRLIIIGSVSFYTIFTTIYFFLSFFRCGRAPWNTGYYSETGSCSGWLKAAQAFNLAQASLNAAVDWIFCLTPIFVVARSPTIPMATKLSACALILLGSLGSVASIARIVFVVPEVAPSSWGRMTAQPRALDVQFSCVVETGTGIICLAMAALRPLFRVLVQKWKAGIGRKLCNTEQVTTRNTDQSIELHANGSEEKLTKIYFSPGKDLDLFSDDDLMDGTTLGAGSSSQSSWCEFPDSTEQVKMWDHTDAVEKGEAHMTS